MFIGTSNKTKIYGDLLVSECYRHAIRGLMQSDTCMSRNNVNACMAGVKSCRDSNTWDLTKSI